MTNTNQKSKQFLADKPIQGGLCIRVAIYWLASQFVTLAVVSGVFYLQNGNFDDSFRFLVPALIAGLITLPLAVSDMLCFSNRFAGALLNFRRKFHKLSLGQPSEKLVLRPNDLLQDIGNDYNQLRDRLLANSAVEEAEVAAEAVNELVAAEVE